MDGVADGDHIAGPAHVQVRPGEGDQARVGHSMLVPTQHSKKKKNKGCLKK